MKMNHAAPIITAATVLLFAGCGGAEQEAASQPEQGAAAAGEAGQSTAASESEDILGAPMHDALDKANAVEDQVMEQKKDIDEALEAAQDGDTDDE